MKNKWNLLLGTALACGFLTLGVVSCGNQNSETPVEPEKPNPEKPVEPEKPDNIGSKYECISIADAIAKAKEAGDKGTTEEFTIYGTVVDVTNPEFGEMNVTDGKDTIYIYGIEGYKTMTEKPLKGDEVVLKGKLKTYKNKAEMGRATLLEFKANEPVFNESDYTLKNVLEARNAKAGTKVKVSGTVANITYGQKKIPNGFYLVDNTNSIYVYSPDVVQRVKVGNTITIFAERVNHISSKETADAAKFGYTGCIQLANAILKENDEKVSEFDTSWIQKSTIKEIVEAPTDPNNTTTIYNVTGFIHKSVNPGYTNYIINDLDDKTGSYVYTSSSGADFTWLDPFDGKLCDILLSPINAKCTSSSMVYRFMPISAKESTYKMEDKDVAKFALDYYANDQFIEEYNSNPSLEVVTSVSNAGLGIENVKITYVSDNLDAVEFVEKEGKTIMNTKNDGVANITIHADYKGLVADSKVTIKVKNIDISDAIGVKAAIDTADGEIVKVKGVVVASVVNRDAFYIGDETGVIAVMTTKVTLGKIKLGQQVYFEGTRAHFKKDTTDFACGQSVIKDASLLLNEYGNHEYSTASFDTTKTIADLTAIAVTEDVTAQVYTVKSKIEVVEGQYSTNIYLHDLVDSSKSLMLYCSSSKQYGWLTDFKDEPEVTLELALCNWNDKKVYKCCVLSASTGTKKVVNNLNFAK